MKTNTSLAKTEANKKNARLSTGPKTQTGKTAVKWNALKHGLLAKEVVISTGDGKESNTEFQSVLDALTLDLQPCGSLEEMLVEKIASCYWRLRRVLRCEVGEVRGSPDTYTFDRAIEQTQTVNELLEKSSWDTKGKEKELILTVPGINALLQCVASLRSDIKDHGTLSDDSVACAKKLFGTADGTFGDLLLYYDWLATDEGQQPGESSEEEEIPEPDKCRKIILEMLAKKEKELKNALDVIGEREKLRTQAIIASRSIPSDKSADRLLRYETSIERSLYKALHELQRLQAARSNQTVPAPIVIDLECDQPEA